MTFRVRHEWPDKPQRILSAELVTCPHCGTLRVTEEGRPTRFLRSVACKGCLEGTPHTCERSREDEPPCIEPPQPKYRTARKRDQIGCELTPMARERALRELERRR